MLYIGIDGGGTKTKMTLFSEDGTKIKEVIKPSVHILTTKKEDCIHILKEGVDELDKDNHAQIIAGFAGYGQQIILRKQIEEICKKAFGNREFSLYSDIEIAINGALNGKMVLL